jgi:ATPase subunit of ABC transporter with duplicated ATPase domains
MSSSEEHSITSGPSLEEMHKGYQMYVQRKQKQCEYQKKYLEKKKTESTHLQEIVNQLQEQNAKLMVYYQLYEMLKLQNPQLADQLVNQLKFNNNQTAPSCIISPQPFNFNYGTTPSWPQVSMKFPGK